MNDKKRSPLEIPITKFSSPSCYSFIVRYTEEEIEIYLPPVTKLRKDLGDWLLEQEFKQHEDLQVYIAKRSRPRKEATGKLLEAAKKNGAYSIASDIDPQELEDRAIDRSRVNTSQVVKNFAASVSKAVEEKLESRLADIVKNLEQQRSAREEDRRIIAEAKAKEEEYKKKIKELEEQLRESEAEKNSLKSALKTQTTGLFEYRSIFEDCPEDDESDSPFDSEPDSPLHLNSPFRKRDYEILNNEEFDDSLADKKINQPYQVRSPERSPSVIKSLNKILSIPDSLPDNLDSLRSDRQTILDGLDSEIDNLNKK